MEIISFLNFKGGVGKTTSTHSIGAALNILGKKVLMIDMDPQGSLTFFTKNHDEVLNGTSKDLLFDEKHIDNCINKTNEFDYIGTTIELATSEINLHNSYNKEVRLKNAIENMSDNLKYDYCLIDCPPSLSIFTLNALTASDSLIIPCECELAAIEGLQLLLNTLKEPIKHLNPKLKITGILPTKLDGRKKISKEVYETIKEDYDNVFPPIRINSKLSELGLEKQSLFMLDKSSNGAKDYLEVGRVIMNGNK